MKQRLLLIFFTALFFHTTITAQKPDEESLSSSMESLLKAMIDADKIKLEKLSHDSLSYGHSGGNVENKALFVENITNGNSDFVSINITEQTVSVIGKTAIIRHKLSAATNNKGKGPATVNLAVIYVWHKDKKEWKMLARQAVKLP